MVPKDFQANILEGDSWIAPNDQSDDLLNDHGDSFRNSNRNLVDRSGSQIEAKIAHGKKTAVD